MSEAYLNRAVLLLRQSRPELAEKELRQQIAADPDDAFARAMLALCLLRCDRAREATDEAELAILKDPTLAYAHYARAAALHDRDREREADEALDEAIRLDPTDASQFDLRAEIRYSLRDWQGSCEAAERGLALDPEHKGCTNIRAMALVKLGRRDVAEASIDAALARDPENALTHANRGWTYLEAREPVRALEHFREALRLQPSLEMARKGMVEALKARYLVYRWLLAYFMWLSKFSWSAQIGIMIGVAVAFRYVRGFARANPEWAPVVMPLYYAYLLFALLTFLGDPLFNLLLRLNRFGRLALSREEIVASNWTGGILATAIILLVFGWLLPGGGALWLAGIMAFALSLPVSSVYLCDAGWPRNVMAWFTVTLAALAVAALTLPLFPPAILSLAGLGAFVLFWLGFLVSLLLSSLLPLVTPRK